MPTTSPLHQPLVSSFFTTILSSLLMWHSQSIATALIPAKIVQAVLLNALPAYRLLTLLLTTTSQVTAAAWPTVQPPTSSQLTAQYASPATLQPV